MKKKVLIAVFIIITIMQSIIPIKIEATNSEYESISMPAKMEHKNAPAEQEYDVKAGIILEPTIELVTAIADAIMSAISSLMTETKFEFVMKKEVTNITEEATGKYTIEDMTKYENALGLATLRYPNFTYSPEEIFAGNIDLLDINFIKESNSNEGWQKIRNIISQWYKVLRMIAIIGLLSVLIYTGIKIIISSNTKQKAKYKEFIINWFIAVILAFSLHYIMAFILEIVEQTMGLLKGISGIIEVHAGDTVFKTNLIGLARFQLQETSFVSKLFYLIMYVALITYTIKFTFLYFKRVLKMAFLTVISPIVALTYPIDKLNDGKAQGFNMWLKEFLFNVLLQPMHYILYYILVTTSLALAAQNPLYGVVALMFISQAEKLLKKFFGFDKARAGTVGGVAGAFATGAATATLTRMAKDPMHPIKALTGSGGKSKGSSSGKGSNWQTSYTELPNDLRDDTNIEDFVNTFGDYSIPNRSQVEDEGVSQGQQKRQMNVGEESVDNRNAILAQIVECEEELQNPDNTPEENDALNAKLTNLRGMLQSGAVSSGFGFDTDMNDNTDMTIDTTETQGTQITGNENNSSEEKGVMSKIKNAPVIKGVANVGKTILRPAWDFDKEPKDNAKRLGGKLLRGTAGAAVGITAAAVQAGISITDGKYKAIEGVATIGAGIAGVSQIGKGSNGVVQTYKQAANEGQDGKALKQYTEQWYNRDDVINYYNKEFPGKGKEMRKRAANNYVSRGITDIKEQKKAIKFANQLKKERGMEEEEADRVAAATLRYKQNMDKSIIYDEEKREKFIDAKVEAYTGSASKKAVRRVHEEFLQNIIDFDRANA